MKIFEINENINYILSNFLDEETGELNESVLDDLNKLELEKETKCLNLAKYVKQLQVEHDGIKSVKDDLNKRQSALKKKIEGIKNYLSYAAAGENYKDSEITISWRKSVSVNSNIDENIHMIPSEFLEPQPDKILKALISKALKAGRGVEGAFLEEKNNIQIK